MRSRPAANRLPVFAIVSLVALASDLAPSAPALADGNVSMPPLLAGSSEIPESWHGHWSGPLIYVTTDGSSKTLTMDLVIRAEPVQGRLDWTIRYEGQPARRYEMILLNAQRGHYLLDERNGILIDHFFLDGTLHSEFEVSGNRISTTLKMRDGKLVQEMSTYAAYRNVRRSGGGPVPVVSAYQLLSSQRAVLEKR